MEHQYSGNRPNPELVRVSGDSVFSFRPFRWKKYPCPRKTGQSRGNYAWSVFVSTHYREHACRHRWISLVWAVHTQIEIVVVNLEEVPLILNGYGPEIVLAVRIVLVHSLEFVTTYGINNRGCVSSLRNAWRSKYASSTSVLA